MIKIPVSCKYCDYSTVLEVDRDKYDRWENRELLLQNAFPHLLPAERELLKSRICGKCWDDMFKPS